MTISPDAGATSLETGRLRYRYDYDIATTRVRLRKGGDMQSTDALRLWDVAVEAWRGDQYRVGDWQGHEKTSGAGVDAVLALAATFADPIRNAHYALDAGRYVCSPAGVACGL